jgi:hypothetical protein
MGVAGLINEFRRSFLLNFFASSALLSLFFELKVSLENLDDILRRREWVGLGLAFSNGSVCKKEGVGDSEPCSLSGGVKGLEIL